METSQAELFLSRELAALEFNFRVLAQARDTSIPLLERLRYLSIDADGLSFATLVLAQCARPSLRTKIRLELRQTLRSAT
ncbi:hypothetical protein ISP18_00960 [Dyella humi]|uniref:Polyphosphate kinase N-terminal domain-containing protein n=1 Tax=Dyella humi TaxID=1770547 RepID=A0ABW8IDB6_9GAMM